MSAIRGPEPPYPGAVYQARTKSGRRWEVMYLSLKRGQFGAQDDTWRLRPMGDDVYPAQNEEGEMQGGVREIERTTEQLRNPKKWRHVGVTARAAR
jgi:hypothetical protein